MKYGYVELQRKNTTKNLKIERWKSKNENECRIESLDTSKSDVQWLV